MDSTRSAWASLRRQSLVLGLSFLALGDFSFQGVKRGGQRGGPLVRPVISSSSTCGRIVRVAGRTTNQPRPTISATIVAAITESQCPQSLDLARRFAFHQLDDLVHGGEKLRFVETIVSTAADWIARLSASISFSAAVAIASKCGSIKFHCR